MSIVQLPIGGRMKFNAMPRQDLARLDLPRILVVEDEFIIRLHISDYLRDFGYTVSEASSGDEALVILAAGADFDIVYTDVRMPGRTDGLALLDFIRRTRPGVVVVVTSGHLHPSLAMAAGAAGFIAKPCEPEMIVCALMKALKTVVLH